MSTNMTHDVKKSSLGHSEKYPVPSTTTPRLSIFLSIFNVQERFRSGERSLAIRLQLIVAFRLSMTGNRKNYMKA